MVIQIFSRHPEHGYMIQVGTWVDGVAIFDCRPYHRFRNRNAWGIDEDAFISLPPDTKQIVLDIHENGSRRKLSVDIRRFAAESWLHSWPGFNTRRFLEAEKWESGDGTGEAQGELFGEVK